jgi:hypothetical protein
VLNREELRVKDIMKPFKKGGKVPKSTVICNVNGSQDLAN